MILDANACLRYLLNDVPLQAREAKRAIVMGAGEITPEILCECVYVLSGNVYGIPREEVAEALSLFLDEVDCDRKPIMLRALSAFKLSGFDFVDCILLATHELAGAEVLTFDKKLKRAIEGNG